MPLKRWGFFSFFYIFQWNYDTFKTLLNMSEQNKINQIKVLFEEFQCTAKLSRDTVHIEGV